jgi:long-chain acyl-CoA synthetase
MSYIGGWQQPLAFLCAGGSFVLDEPFSPKSIYRFWDTVLRYKADSLWLTPSMLAALLAVGPEDDAQRDALKGILKRITVAMGGLPAEVKQRFEALFGLRLQKALGITETLLCCNWHGDLTTPEASVGRPVEGVEIGIFNDSGEALPAREEGEIRIRGEWIFDGYWRQEHLNASAFDANGYFRTGDLGMMDEASHLFITGRIKDMIKCGGLNVAPAEIEATLCRFGGVKEAAVVGVPDVFYGEKIIAFITLAPGSAATVEGALAFCREELAAAKVPSHIYLREQMPMSAVGKIDKRALKAELTGKGG